MDDQEIRAKALELAIAAAALLPDDLRLIQLQEWANQGPTPKNYIAESVINGAKKVEAYIKANKD